MDIQEQIKELTEKFSNLFEVEGIGGNDNNNEKPYKVTKVDSSNSLNNNKKNKQEYQPKKGQEENPNPSFEEVLDKIMGKGKTNINFTRSFF